MSDVKFMSDMMAVMNDGRIVEFGPSESIYAHPKQDYTRKLIEAVPQASLERIEARQRERRQALEGRLKAS
jgi:peptide/nickel transport system ATP-binding protein